MIVPSAARGARRSAAASAPSSSANSPARDIQALVGGPERNIRRMSGGPSVNVPSTFVTKRRRTCWLTSVSAPAIQSAIAVTTEPIAGAATAARATNAVIPESDRNNARGDPQ